ncbi:MAG: TIGR00159 family protein [Kofleriaceae bacterium]|nr:TIGR00159 family protein [Kofleriaceae bacterium]
MSEIWGEIMGLGTRDLAVSCIDILLVYYVIYRVLLTIQGTRAAQMVIGIVLIGGAFFAAERFDMRTVSWLLDNFIEYFIVIVIVVFQQDIRRALMTIGQNVSRFGRTQAISQALDEILAAAEHLAKARMGGIVVFEGEVRLDEFLDHGEPIDAEISKELLVALFVPSRDNELHDGAVIIRNLRLNRAGAVLPLSRSNIASDFGTRHRAALGITEDTDAVALVISEERGEVSLCYKGHIARDLEMHELRTALQELFDGSPSEPEEMVSDDTTSAVTLTKTISEGERVRDETRRTVARSEAVGRTTTDSLRAATLSSPKDV